MAIKDKINQRMDKLQEMMESNVHLERPAEVAEHIYSVSKFWSVLSDEDKDYIDGSRYALEEQIRWELPEKK